MLVQDAQREVRSVYQNGWVGQLVSGFVWAISAALGTWVSLSSAMLALILGGVLIFPLTTLAIKLMGGRGSLSKGNPLNALAMQIAFTLPLAIPIILWAAQFKQGLFYPAFMIILGAHYLPFIFLYGMKQFAVLAAVLLGAGVALGMIMPDAFLPGGWFTAAVLILFALLVRLTMKIEQPTAALPSMKKVRARR